MSVSHPSTAHVLLHHVMGELEDGSNGDWGYTEGGNGRLSEILAQSSREEGAEIRVNARVEEILYDGQESPVGVRVEGGEIIEGKTILSNCTNRVTFFNLIKNPEKHLSRSVLNRMRNIEYNGAATKINLVLRKLPKLKALAGSNHPLEAMGGTIHFNSYSMEQL